MSRAATPLEYPYGWRFVKRTLPDGSTDLDQVPLTLEDVLHPQEDDFIPQCSLHEMERGYLTAVLRSRDLKPPIVHVTADLLIDWGVPGIRNHSPDVAVFAGLRQQPDLNEGTFHLAESGGRCLAAFEIVWPGTRVNDMVHKLDHYYRVGVPHYVLIDQEREEGPRQVVGFRPGIGKFEREPLEEGGSLKVPEASLRLGLREGRLICWDLNTGKEFPDPPSAYRELQEKRRIIQEKARLLEQMERDRREALEQARYARERASNAEQARRDAEQLHQARNRIQELEELLRRAQGSSAVNE
jgi:hypothetical protein